MRNPPSHWLSLPAACLSTVALSALCYAQQPNNNITPFSPQGQADLARILTPSTDGVAKHGLNVMVVPDARTPTDRLRNWSELALELSAADHARGPSQGYNAFGPHRSSRAIAIAHIAMYDAVNAITKKYKSYTGIGDADPAKNASIDLAIAVAARDTLIELFSLQKERVENAYRVDENRISIQLNATIPDPQMNRDAKSEAQRIGKEAAKAILAKRANDKASLPEPDLGTQQEAQQMPDKFIYLAPDPGVYQVDPISNIRVAVGYNWGKVEPFVLTAQQMADSKPKPPPAIGSKEYAALFKEVKELGGDPNQNTLTTRKDFETFKGIFWAYDGTPELCAPPRLYNQVARQIMEQNGGPVAPDVSDFSRYLALINVAMADTAIVTWEAKWSYKYWRPVTAIRYDPDNDPATDNDGNPDTVADTAFYPLGAPATNARGPNFTPPFPAYPSGHAAFGGALFEVMRLIWGEGTSVELVSDEYNGLNLDQTTGLRREFRSFQYVRMSEPEWENARSRIWLGIHWQVDADAGVASGNKVAKFVFENSFLPR